MAKELWIYDVIGADFFGEGVTAKSVRDELRGVDPAERLLVRINSPGGLVFEAASIVTLLGEHPGGVDVQIDGVAASAASYIAMVGQKVAMSDGAMLMIHDPWSIVIGDSRDMVKEAELLDKMAVNLAGAYVAKSGKTEKEIREAMLAETWFTADEAVEFGLADSKLESFAKAYTIPGKFGYRNAPQPQKEIPPHAKPASVAAMTAQLQAVRAELLTCGAA
ncbi:MAG: Clp protease ClpP [Planctomycetales bacterium]|nr:Clp protease ClpP [Planctomycetales bacterium]